MAKLKKAPEKIADHNDRTNSIGLFNTAEAYWLSASKLAAAEVRHGFADLPVRTLYYHAIELYLKALLRQHYSVDELQSKGRTHTGALYSHRLRYIPYGRGVRPHLQKFAL